MKKCADDVRVAYPLFHTESGGSTPTSALQLYFRPCRKSYAVCLVKKWHSRLPKCQKGPWQLAFCADCQGLTYAVALWHNPSARCLPSHWLELRRLAVSPDSPKNTCSRFLMWMVRYFKKNYPEREKCISYQDTHVHTGTIYAACSWKATHKTTERIRDRSKQRIGTNRAYRSNLNGDEIDKVSKIRWEYDL